MSPPPRRRALATLAIAAAAMFLPACWMSSSDRDWKTVRSGLRVERSSGQLLLTWDRQSALVENATQATLTILDGDHKEDVDLDLATLRNGSLVYSPITADVSFRLELVDARRGAHDTESARSSDPKPMAPGSVLLGLRVESSNGQLLLSWNRQCAAIQDATGATLTIIDGDHKEDLDLDLAVLKAGSIVYYPVTGDVSLWLEVFDARRGTHGGESVRFSGPAPRLGSEGSRVKP